MQIREIMNQIGKQYGLQVEQIYQTWNTVSLDLHNLNIEGNSILAFSDGLNKSTQAIKSKDKAKAMEELVKLYELLPKYAQTYEPEAQKTKMLAIETQVVASYVSVTNEKWQDAATTLTEAEKQFANILNTVNENHENQTTMSQCYIIVNELRNAVNLKDKDIFYIQYHNFITKMGMLV